MNKLNKILIVFVTLMLMISFASAGAGYGHEDSKGKGHNPDQNDGKGHDKHRHGDDGSNDDDGSDNNSNDDSNDDDNSNNESDDDDVNGNINTQLNYNSNNKCSFIMVSPANFNNYSIGDIVPTLYTWDPVNDRCNYTTTEHHPAPHEFYGSVICSPSRVFGEIRTNFWNTPRGKRILAWKANSKL